MIGPRLRTARLAQTPPWSLEELSALLEQQSGLELSAATLSKIERGLRSVYDFEVIAFCRLLKIDPSVLLGFTAERPPTVEATN
nr:helix-turn-helix transcriptional regulator [Deinococcus alpinitundrae]